MNTRRAVLIAAVFAFASSRILAADHVEAIEETPPAVEGGEAAAGPNADAEAMNRLGTLYASGNGVPQDFVAALAWYRRAAESGSTHAMINLATMYYHGLGAPKSYEEAVKWLRLAVERGDAAAQNRLGLMYAAGVGVPKDEHTAFEFFLHSASQGYAPAMANLGRVYASGAGAERDEVLAYALLSAALELGVPEDAREAALYNLGALSQRLTAAQLERAQADARTLKERWSKKPLAEPAASASNALRL